MQVHNISVMKIISSEAIQCKDYSIVNTYPLNNMNITFFVSSHLFRSKPLKLLFRSHLIVGFGSPSAMQ